MKTFTVIITLMLSINVFAMEDCFIKVSLLTNTQVKLLLNTRYIKQIQNNPSTGSIIHLHLKQHLVRESINDIEKMINQCYKK